MDGTGVPGQLLRRLDDLGVELDRRGDAVALIAVGSVGQHQHRLDEHSDLDFFVVVDDDAAAGYLESIDWLEALSPVVYDFRNTEHGRKVLFADGLYAEYAVFTRAQLADAAFAPGRLVWRRAGEPDGLELPRRPPAPTAGVSAEHQVGEALTNLYVGLHREARGEQLSALRLVQVHAVDRVLTLAWLLSADPGGQQDPFAVERGAETSWAPHEVPLAAMTPGYGRTCEAALAVLGWLEEHTDVHPAMADEVRGLATRRGSREAR